jgi:TRAP-type mannitol/chloroaromatic compound transport system substrate-binding protein
VNAPGRRFLAATAGTAVAGAIAAPSVIAQPKVQWRMPAAYTPALDVLQGAAVRVARTVDEMTGGRVKIEVFPGGQIVQPFELFDAASKGTIDAFMAVASYWAGPTREPALEWFMTVPFGMDPTGMAAGYREGEGLKLWEEAYAPFNLVPRPGFSNAPQMAGWFRRKIGAISDFKGLKMRIAGLGGKVLARAGATTIVTPASEIYPLLERGVLDAAEWVGPHDDMKLGLHTTARHYYYPGWHEPGTVEEFTFNRKAYEALPADLRRTLDHAVASTTPPAFADYRVKNARALDRLRGEFKGKVEVLPLPAAVLRGLKKVAVDVIQEHAEKSSLASKVHASFTRFQALVGAWDPVAEGAYHKHLVAGGG